ncbi:hypothetical protein GOV14_00700, partial [Candidatus Pacearchaeota archaeon]|nr:hypothetical protein [Candidatus Pacearchaeota archaeon]
MKNRNKTRRKLLPLAFLVIILLLLNTDTAFSFSTIANSHDVPIIIQIFLLLNVFQLSLAMVIIFEIKNNLISKTWDSIIKGNFFALLHTIMIALILSRSYQTSGFFLVLLTTFFYSLAVSMDLATQFLLAKPLMKIKLNVFKPIHLLIYSVSLVFSWLFLIRIGPLLTFPTFSNFNFLFLYMLFFVILNAYIVYSSHHISGAYSKLGFVHEPYITAWIGLSSLLGFGVLTFYIALNNLFSEYYFVLTWIVFVSFAVAYYFKFIIEYPSLLQPKWKAFMPFDLVKVTATITLVILSVSLYFTTKDLGLQFSIPILVLFIVGLFLIPIAALFIYARSFAGETTLEYWNYIKWEVAAHLGLSFYILSTAILSWPTLGSLGRILYGLFFGLSFLFYLATTLDIRKLTQDLNVKIKPDIFIILGYTASTFSLFFIIFSLVFLSRGKVTSVDIILGRYPYFPLMLIGVFFVFYFTFLRRAHKGFEELLKRGTSTAFSYIAALGVFVSLFILYLKVPSSLLSQFPFFGLVFFGYFAILVADVYSTTTLRVKEYSEKK